MNEEQNGRFEAIMKKVLAYKEESKDPMFTQYLASFQQRLISKQHEIDILGVELEEKHALYLQRKTQMEEGTLPLEADEALQEGTQVQAAQKAPKEQKTKKSGEFAIGTYAFSAVGMVFLLVSFGMLGKYFMNDFVKGVFLKLRIVLLPLLLQRMNSMQYRARNLLMKPLQGHCLHLLLRLLLGKSPVKKKLKK